MGRVAVVGGSLPGLAAAARLAKVGHSVVLHEARPVLGGRWAEPGVLPDVLDFPAPWRDLFKKSGRPLSAELARAGLDLVPAPDAVVVLGAALLLAAVWNVVRLLQGRPPMGEAAQSIEAQIEHELKVAA